MRKSIQAIVGRSDENLSSALDSLPDHLHIRFTDMNPKYEYNLIKDQDENTTLKRGLRKRPAARTAEFERTTSVFQRTIDQFEVNFDFFLIENFENETTDVFQAARHGNLDQMKALYDEHIYDHKAFFNRQDPETKLTALHYAARFHHLEVCRFLVEKCEADVRKTGEDGMTALHYMARFRLERGSQVNKRKIKVIHHRFCLDRSF